MSEQRRPSAPFGNCAGAILGDAGPLTLAAARALAGFYLRESQAQVLAGAPAWGRLCAARAARLASAIGEAAAWRRAAGWRRPEDADEPVLPAFRPRAAPPGHQSA